MSVENVFKKFYVELLSILPMNEDKFNTLLFLHNVVTYKLKTQIDLQPTSTEKATLLLRVMSEQTVASGVDTHYYELLNVMEKSGNNVKELAQQIRTTLNESVENESNAVKIDREIQREISKCTCASQFKVQKIEEGKYRFGESQQPYLVRILRTTVMVRMAGGWSTLTEFLNKHDFCRSVASKLKHEILQAMLEARDANCSVCVRYGKVLFCGAGAAGKSNFLNLLLEEDFQSSHISTEVAKPHQITIAMKALICSNEDEVKFEKMNTDDEILQLMSYLPEKCNIPTAPSESSTSTANNNVFTQLQDSQPQDESDTAKSSELALANVSSVAKKLPKKPPGEVWDVLTFMDTGGQPQFISMLPVINSFAMITFIVHNMTGGKKGLHSKVEVKHGNKDGERSFIPYLENYTHLQLIKTLMSYANSILLPDKNFLTDFQVNKADVDCESKASSLISLVGTHSNEMAENDIVEINRELIETLKHSGAARKVNPGLNENYRYLVPVDNKKQLQRKELSELEVSNTNPKKFTNPSKIRKHIFKQLQEQDQYSIPIHWLLLELEIRKKCGDKKFISYDDVLLLSREKKLGDENFVKNGLRFHHLFGVLLYFEDIKGMKDLVITDHQWLFDKLTKIVVDSFKSKCDKDEDYDDRERRGILKESMLDKLDVDSDFEMAGINITNKSINPKKAFLKLLKHLRIIAKINENPTKYFMPTLLDSFEVSNIQENQPWTSNCFTTATNETISSVPLLIQFESSDCTNLFPRGIFCFLVVQLIKSSKSVWKPCKQTYNNFITLINKVTSHYIVLIDRIFFLEVQVAHVSEEGHWPAIHSEIFDIINNSLVEFGKEFNICVKLKYGFICKNKECLDKEMHMSYVEKESIKSSFCSNDEPTKLESSHKVWLESFHKNLSPIKQDGAKSPDVNIKDVYDKFYPQLVTSLPMKDDIFVAHLIKLLPGDLKHKVGSETKSTPAEAATCFLDNSIEPAVKNGYNKPLTILLAVMEASDNILLGNLAKEIRKEIQQLKPDTGTNLELFNTMIIDGKFETPV